MKDLAEKSKKVEAALKEMQKREEELKLHQERELVVMKRKEEMEQKIKDRILSANRSDVTQTLSPQLKLLDKLT